MAPINNEEQYKKNSVALDDAFKILLNSHIKDIRDFEPLLCEIKR